MKRRKRIEMNKKIFFLLGFLGSCDSLWTTRQIFEVQPETVNSCPLRGPMQISAAGLQTAPSVVLTATGSTACAPDAGSPTAITNTPDRTLLPPDVVLTAEGNLTV